MGAITVEGRTFRGLHNVTHGEVSAETVFRYHQRGDVIWATYEGGEVVFGTLIGRVEWSRTGTLTIRYQQLNRQGDFRSGQCITTIEVLAGGRCRLHESWRWTACEPRGEAGTSICEEETGTVN
jgi:hypothetical protein